jgi:hypothetical protein
MMPMCTPCTHCPLDSIETSLSLSFFRPRYSLTYPTHNLNADKHQPIIFKLSFTDVALRWDLGKQSHFPLYTPVLCNFYDMHRMQQKRTCKKYLKSLTACLNQFCTRSNSNYLRRLKLIWFANWILLFWIGYKIVKYVLLELIKLNTSFT